MSLMIAAGLLVALIGILWLWALSLPPTRTGVARMVIAASPAAILAVIEDVDSQPAWRDTIKSIERDGEGWTETTKRGEKIRFTWLDRTMPNISLKFTSDAGYGGTWLAILRDEPSGTSIEVTETATIPNPVTRLMARLFFDPQAFARAYLLALKARVEGLT